MTNDQRSDLKSALRLSEGWVPYLYLDTEGNVTVGCGHKVPTFAHALHLPFVPKVTPREWHDVQSAPKGMRASAYFIDSRARLTDAKIDALLDADIDQVQRELAERFRDYASWPAPADAAMCDVAFNVGLARFPKLCAAASERAWATCAVECHRIGIAEARNEATSLLFRHAAEAVKTTA